MENENRDFLMANHIGARSGSENHAENGGEEEALHQGMYRSGEGLFCAIMFI